ncbi:MAG: biotin--[acetyl-CoA-carboxylase] ligase [Opitutaceae bacterium]|jgi:BirA family transcriptional regulator, biotin operon repressor / biotin---[acetyl-CoA-carboxylase] ligase|nr:biotin--[acetyl-CoA-carboxylase] ligase [Opitutaceae bacterium]
MKTTTPDLTIVRTMLDAGDGFISGSALAQKLGISRVAIWQHMEKLRDRGFIFEAIRSRGYRLAERPTKLDSLMIEARLPPSESCRVITLNTVDSTNDEAMRQLGAGTSTPLVVISSEQTKGRGRLGRDWLSEPNGNLYLSFAFNPEVSPDQLPTITPWVGVNLCYLLSSYARVTPQIKWPNDLQINGRKVGGILTEARLDADRIRDLVIGCGLNLKAPQAGWNGDLKDRAIALDEVASAPIDLNHFAATLVGKLLTTCREFRDGIYHDRLAELWHRYDALRDRKITLIHGRENITGIAHGIDADGSLLLKTEDGPPQQFRAGEVTIAKR